MLEQYKTLQYEGDLLLPTREKEVVLYKMTVNNTKKPHWLLLFFYQTLGACNSALFYKVISDTFFRIFWAIIYIHWGEGLNLNALK